MSVLVDKIIAHSVSAIQLNCCSIEQKKTIDSKKTNELVV